MEEKRCVTTLITAAEEATEKRAVNHLTVFVRTLLIDGPKILRYQKKLN